jgi:hypothetical protein
VRAACARARKLGRLPAFVPPRDRTHARKLCCRPRAAAADAPRSAPGGLEEYDIRRAPLKQDRLFFPDELVRLAVQHAAAGQRPPETLFKCERTRDVLHAHRALLQHDAGAQPCSDATSLEQPTAAEAQQVFLRLLDAVNDKCPEMLRGFDGAASTPADLRLANGKDGLQQHLKSGMRTRMARTTPWAIPWASIRACALRGASHSSALNACRP